MSFPYCEKYRFDAKNIERRLKWFELGAADHATAKQLQNDIIRPHVGEIIDDFYTWLDTLEEAKIFLQNEELRSRLQETQSHYLSSLGVNFTQPDYFESRLRVGQIHMQVGLDLSLYQCAFRHFGQLILNLINHQNQGLPHLAKFVYKIIAMDMSLAIETYHLLRVQSLEESLNRSQHLQHSFRLAACMDSLTGLSNHKTIVDKLEKALGNLATPMVILMADIDFFKKVNDTYGHLVGDKVLVEIAKRMRNALRDADSIGRYGGEEFLLILHDSKLDTALQIAERIRLHVAEQPIKLDNLQITVTLSLGLSEAQPGDNNESLIKRADQALYTAKSSGRNRVEIA